jgi:hypothetical protein
MEDLLWFGDLIKYRVLQKPPLNMSAEQRREREVHLSRLGLQDGLICCRPGLLTPAKERVLSLSVAMARSGAMLFEPESLYRGVLYAAALSTIALTNGSRMSELLQISADRFKVRTYDVKQEGQPTGERRTIYLQWLLPKGKMTEEDRKLFLISEGAYMYLQEIACLLREAHDGRIPVVSPNRQNAKAEDLHPERYLFQWATESTGRFGALSPADAGALLRFILYGVNFATKQGEPFAVSVHLFRHVMATVARHEYEVPLEAVAYALHHTCYQTQSTCQVIAPATVYYSQQTEEMALSAMASFHTSLEKWVAVLEVGFPDEQTLEHLDEDLRESFERWHTLLETTLGFCGNVDLCPRGYNRTLCIGCPHLVPDPRKQQIARYWRAAYVKLAGELEAQGQEVDARQYRLLVQELDRHLKEMEMLQGSIEDGTRKPVFLLLPSAPYQEVIIDAEA